MPIKLNLHHEIDKQKALKRRDPLKIAGAGIVAIAVCFAAYYVYELEQTYRVKEELSAAQFELSKLQPKADAAKKRADELEASIKASDLLVKRVEERFYWAPVLANLASVVPREVQITKFSGDVSGESLKHCAITIDGVATGKDPRATAEELRKSIGDSFSTKYKNVSSTFKGNIEDTTQTAKLDGNPMQTVDFTIVVQLQVGEEVVVKAPVRRKRDIPKPEI